ncbi:MAG: hypothetical protein LBB21_07025 [Holosporaceae bacterium]|nr:hypothetical protein [Holosporaceae bacterium]
MEITYCERLWLEPNPLAAIQLLLNIEQLTVDACKTLTSFDMMGFHPKLKTLRLYRCDELTSLVGIVDCFPKLEKLYINSCKTIRSLDGKAQCLDSLSVLCVLDCQGLTSLDEIRFLPNLEELGIRNLKLKTRFDYSREDDEPIPEELIPEKIHNFIPNLSVVICSQEY